MVADRTVKTKYKSSCQEVFFKKGVYRNLEKIHRKAPMPESVFKSFREKNSFSYRTPPVAATYNKKKSIII